MWLYYIRHLNKLEIQGENVSKGFSHLKVLQVCLINLSSGSAAIKHNL